MRSILEAGTAANDICFDCMLLEYVSPERLSDGSATMSLRKRTEVARSSEGNLGGFGEDYWARRGRHSTYLSNVGRS
jgi:hypothetical protein